MPELPEVEIASRQLRAWTRGREVVRAVASRSRVIRGQAPQRFAELGGRAVRHIERVGKWMLLEFDGGAGLLSHLGMTGKWIATGPGGEEPSHVRARLELDDGHVLHYRDPRLFGRLIRGTPEELRALPALRSLGPDPLRGVDAQRLGEVLARTKRSLKEALMDQRTLAGLGNIQVSESLFRARLHPARASSSLQAPEVRRLAAAIEESLAATLAAEDGPVPLTYVEEGGENRFLVYDRAGTGCPRCGTPLQRIVQGGRSSYFCPRCQRPSGARKAGKRSAARAGASRSS